MQAAGVHAPARGLITPAMRSLLFVPADSAKKLDKALNKDEAIALAGEVGIAATLKTKKAALDEIKRKNTTRKGSHERTQFGPPDRPTEAADQDAQSLEPAAHAAGEIR